MGVKVGVSMVMVQVLVGFIRFGGMEEGKGTTLVLTGAFSYDAYHYSQLFRPKMAFSSGL